MQPVLQFTTLLILVILIFWRLESHGQLGFLNLPVLWRDVPGRSFVGESFQNCVNRYVKLLGTEIAASTVRVPDTETHAAARNNTTKCAAALIYM